MNNQSITQYLKERKKDLENRILTSICKHVLSTYKQALTFTSFCIVRRIVKLKGNFLFFSYALLRFFNFILEKKDIIFRTFYIIISIFCCFNL